MYEEGLQGGDLVAIGALALGVGLIFLGRWLRDRAAA